MDEDKEWLEMHLDEFEWFPEKRELYRTFPHDRSQWKHNLRVVGHSMTVDFQYAYYDFIAERKAWAWIFKPAEWAQKKDITIYMMDIT